MIELITADNSVGRARRCQWRPLRVRLKVNVALPGYGTMKTDPLADSRSVLVTRQMCVCARARAPRGLSLTSTCHPTLSHARVDRQNN